MNSNLIYVKTASGEEAMHQRTRVMQRNSRMVLILVDGKSAVSDLALKIGNLQLAESALIELEAGGFIAPQVGQDSLWSGSKEVALGKMTQIASLKEGDVKAQETDRGLDTGTDLAFSQSVFPFPPMPFSDDERPVTERSKESLTKTVANASGVMAKLAKQFRSVFFGGWTIDQQDVSIKPIQKRERRNSPSSSWIGVTMLALLIFFVLSTLVVTFFPYSIFRSDVEAAIARSTGRPVTVGGIRGEFYPKPGLLLTDIKFGNDDGVFRIAEARLLPEPGTLFQPKIIFRQVVLDGVSLPVDLIGGFSDIFASIAAPTSRFELQSVRFEKTDVSFAGLALSGLDGVLQTGTMGSFEDLQLHSSDHGIKLTTKKVGAGVEVNLDARAWRPSEASSFVVNTASLKGVFEKGSFSLKELELHVFDGLVKGVAVLRGDKEHSLTGEIEYERIDAARLGEALGIGQLLAGNASGNLRFSALSDNWTTIFSTMNADGAIALERGTIRGINLSEAVRRVSRGTVQGGATQFEQLSGKIKVTDSSYQLSEIGIDSGLMKSTGSVEVSKDLTLKGRMELQMHGTVNQMRVPVLIGGTLAVPEVRDGDG